MTSPDACPRCRTALERRSGSLVDCPGCGARFRSPLMAALLSMALPGAGHLYLHRRVLAAVELLIGIGLFATALWQLGVTFLRVAQAQAPLLDLLWVCVPWALILGAYSVLDGLFTWIVSRHAVVPVGDEDGP